MSIVTLKDRWRAALAKRYVIMPADRFERWVTTLVEIYQDFKNAGVADRHFDKEILGGNSNKHIQRLSEMLLFDQLRREGFTLSSKGIGPDFRAEKNGQIVWFELVTPQLDDAGVIEKFWQNYAPLHPKSEESLDLQKRLLLRVTNAIAEKSCKFKGYLNETDPKRKTVGGQDLCVIVINDALLCPDFMFYGVTHRASDGESLRPLTVEALLGEGRPNWVQSSASGQYFLRRTSRTSVTKVQEKKLAEDNSEGAEISVAGFHDWTLTHISAVLQVTLREDYAFREELRKMDSPAVHKMQLLRNLLVLNPTAQVPFPDNLIDAQVWRECPANDE